ncbi:MAG: tail fiber domain-containing protein [Candidatus Pacebacteria bacterium]|nr:tail fiber domain-containing protein [Candidatus Paceibacterota bacterium]MCF7857242.1 tail fiber domain-containing protein [Candidatus Paceibacterota bacterium]
MPAQSFDLHRVLIFLILGFLVFIFPSSTFAGVGINAQIPFSGTLANSSGSQLTGSYDMVFKIYDEAATGTVLWEGIYPSVDVSNGSFQVMLGSGIGNEFDDLDFNDDTYYLGMKVGSDTEMTPRERLGSSGYAINSDLLDGLQASAFLRAGHLFNLSTSSASTLFTLNQQGEGDLLNIVSGGTQMLSVLNNGVFKMLSPENSYFAGNIQFADGKGVLFGTTTGGLSLFTNTADENLGMNDLMIGMYGNAIVNNVVNIKTPGSLKLIANAVGVEGDDPLNGPSFLLGGSGGIGNVTLTSTALGEGFDQFFNINMLSGVQVLSGGLTVSSGEISASSFTNLEDTINSFAGAFYVESGDVSYFEAGLKVGDTSGFSFGTDEDVLSLLYDSSLPNDLTFDLQGLGTDEMYVSLTTPADLRFTTNNGDSFNDPDVSINTGDINFGIPTLTVRGSIQSSDLEGGATNLTTDANGNIIRDPSDENLKKNIHGIDNALDTVLKLRGVRYEWRDKERFGEQTEIGFIAQELQLILPEVVRDGGQYLSVNTRNIIAVVVEAIKELNAKVENYFARTERLENDVRILRNEIENLKKLHQEDRNLIEKMKEEVPAASSEPVQEIEEVLEVSEDALSDEESIEDTYLQEVVVEEVIEEVQTVNAENEVVDEAASENLNI